MNFDSIAAKIDTKSAANEGAKILAEGIAGDQWSRQAVGERGITAEIAADLRGLWARTWNTINGNRASWEANPWVWVVSFELASPTTPTLAEANTAHALVALAHRSRHV